MSHRAVLRCLASFGTCRAAVHDRRRGCSRARRRRRSDARRHHATGEAPQPVDHRPRIGLCAGGARHRASGGGAAARGRLRGIGDAPPEAGRLRVEIELVETTSESIVWGEVCEASAADLLDAVNELGNRIVASLTGEIEQAERNRAILRPPASLDAWGAHHRGLWHMYRFTKEDNAQAQHFFARARVARSDLLSRPCGHLLHALAERFPGLERSCTRDRARLCRRGAGPARRRTRPGSALGDGACPVAAQASTKAPSQRCGCRSISARISRSATTRSPSSTPRPATRRRRSGPRTHRARSAHSIR